MFENLGMKDHTSAKLTKIPLIESYDSHMIQLLLDFNGRN